MFISSFAQVPSSNSIQLPAFPDYKNLFLKDPMSFDSIVNVCDSIALIAFSNDSLEDGPAAKYAKWANHGKERFYNELGANPESFYAHNYQYYLQNLACFNSSSDIRQNWVSLGPRVGISKNGGDDPYNQNLGMVTAVAMHPTNHNIIYAGTLASGIWKTLNATQSTPIWENVTDASIMGNIGISDLYIDENNPDIVYATTSNHWYGYNIGIIKTTSGGSVWNIFSPADNNSNSYPAILATANAYLRNITPIPGTSFFMAHNLENIYAFDKGSTAVNGGRVNLNLPAAPNSSDHKINSIAVDNSNSNLVYVAGDFLHVGSKQNTSGALVYNWQRVDHLLMGTPQWPSLSLYDKLTYKVSAKASGGVYVLVDCWDSNNLIVASSLFTFDNSQWVHIDSIQNTSAAIVASKIDDNIIYLMDSRIGGSLDRRVSKSTDGGESFVQQIKEYEGIDKEDNGHAVHCDIRDLEIIESSNGGLNDLVVIGTDGGIAVSDRLLDSSDVSDTLPSWIGKMRWKNVNGEGFATNIFWGVAVPPFGPDIYAFGAQDNHSILNMGNGWRNVGEGDNYDGFLTLNNLNENVYVGQASSGSSHYEPIKDSNYTLSKVDKVFNGQGSTGNRNCASQPIPMPELFSITKWVTQRTKNGDEYYGYKDLSKRKRLDISSSSVENLSNFTDPTGLKVDIGENDYIIDVSIYEANDNYIYLAFPGFIGDGATPFEKKVWRTKNANTPLVNCGDAGPVWEDITPGTGNNYQWLSVKSILVDYSNLNNLYLGLTGHQSRTLNNKISGVNRVIRSTNANTSIASNVTYSDYSKGLPPSPVHEIIMDESSGDLKTLYAATDFGVFYRHSGLRESKTQWECFNENLPMVAVTDIEINYCTHKIYASTFGRGAYAANLPKPKSTKEITFNQTWSSDRNITENIVIKSGVSLFINNATISIGKDVSITVEKGAKLYINNSTLTSGCGEFWSGINVEGTYSNNAVQSSTNGLFGELIVLNNSVIEYADVAVRNWTEGDWSSRGGIVSVTNSTFRNNRNSIALLKFENHNSSTGNIGHYAAKFKNTSFLIDDDYPFDIAPPRPSMVSMWEVRGVNFYGCSFKNESSQRLQMDGIYTQDAYFRVVDKITSVPRGNTVDQSEFVGLRAGITALGSGLGYSFICDHANFINNDIGVQFVDVDNAIVARNLIELDASATNPVPGNVKSKGICIEQSTQFFVQENTINNYHKGITAFNTGFNVNAIRLNDFNNNVTAIWEVGRNRHGGNKQYLGLENICNDFYGVTHRDIEVTCKPWWNILGICGVGRDQGTKFAPAGNKFVSTSIASNPYKDIYNGGGNTSGLNMRYYYYGNGANEEPDEIYNVTTLNEQNNNECQSEIFEYLDISVDLGRLDPLYKQKVRGAIKDKKNALAQTQYLYVALVDGGDTEGLLSSVQTTNAQQAYQLRTNLINSSPLSEEVIFKTIEEGVLSNALLLEVLLENPHAARNEAILKLLEEKPNPMPAYMINPLLGRFDDQTQKDILEGQMAYDQIELNSVVSLMLHHYWADSTGADMDSIPQLYDTMNTFTAHVQWAAHLKGAHNPEYVDVLNDIAENFEVGEEENLLLQNLSDFENQLMYSHDSVLHNLDAGVDRALLTMYTDSLEKHGSYAKNLYTFMNNELYKPIEDNTTAGKKAETEIRNTVFDLRPVETEVAFKLYPNPAKDYITVQYLTEDFEAGSVLKIYNSLGQLVLQTNIFGKQQNIVTSALKTGVYVVTLTSDKGDALGEYTLEIIQ